MAATLRQVRADRAAKLQRIGLNTLEIAQVMGLSRGYTYELLADPTGEEVRARKRRYSRPCPTCGARMDGSNGRGKLAPKHCHRCSASDLGYRRRMSKAQHGKVVWTDEQILEALRSAAAGAPTLSKNRYEAIRAASDQALPGFLTVARRFGSWNQAVSRAGILPIASMRTSYASFGPETCLVALRQVAEELGRLPTYDEYSAIACHRPIPSAGTIRNTLGGWMNAIDALEQERAETAA